MKRQKVQNESPSSLGKESTEVENPNDNLILGNMDLNSQERKDEAAAAGLKDLKILRKVGDVLSNENGYPSNLY